MPEAQPKRIPRQGIHEIFYETRVLMGREFTVQKFAREVLGGSVENVMLSYIEKGQRFPSESLVRRLAAIRGDDPKVLLAVLARDKLAAAVGKEIKKTLKAPSAVRGVEDAELTVLLSRAIAALPEDDAFISASDWRKEFSAPPKRQKHKEPLTKAAAERIEKILLDKNVIERKGAKVRRQASHFTATDTEERQALAIEFSLLFLNGLLDNIAHEKPDEQTYMRNHYFNIDPARIPEFKKRLDDALRGLAQEFAEEPTAETEFYNVLATGLCTKGDER